MNHVLEIEVYTRKCKTCKQVYFPSTQDMGLLCVGGIVMVTYDILYKLTFMVERGLSLAAAASELMEEINLNTHGYLDNNLL